MFKSLFEAAITSVVQKWLSPAQARGEERSPVRLDEEALRAFLIRVGSLATLCLLNFMLFVGAVIVTAVAVAHSFEVYNQFVATPVFWTGIVMLFTALLLEGISAWALFSTKASWRTFFVTEPTVEPVSAWERFATPFLSGLASGLRGDGRAETREDVSSRVA